MLVVLRVSFDEEPLLRSAREQGDVLRYVYIDRSWEKPDRLAFFVERMKYAALATFGLTRYVPSGHLLLVDVATAVPGRRCDRLAECLEPRLCRSHWHRGNA